MKRKQTLAGLSNRNEMEASSAADRRDNRFFNRFRLRFGQQQGLADHFK
jgi:hypothetical protein